jgi:hypothetical protein
MVEPVKYSLTEVRDDGKMDERAATSRISGTGAGRGAYTSDKGAKYHVVVVKAYSAGSRAGNSTNGEQPERKRAKATGANSVEKRGRSETHGSRSSVSG